MTTLLQTTIPPQLLIASLTFATGLTIAREYTSKNYGRFDTPNLIIDSLMSSVVSKLANQIFKDYPSITWGITLFSWGTVITSCWRGYALANLQKGDQETRIQIEERSRTLKLVFNSLPKVAMGAFLVASIYTSYQKGTALSSLWKEGTLAALFLNSAII